MLRILHVVDNDKFIDLQVTRYFTSGIENEIVYLSENFTYNGKYSNIIKWITPFSKDFDNFVLEAKTFDIVIVYFLNYNKAVFVNKIDKDINVIWHFFGAEIYHVNKFRYEYFAPVTRKVFEKDIYIIWKLKSLIKEIKSKLKVLLKVKEQKSMEVFRAIKRTNFFLSYDQLEYNLLKRKLPYLPTFLSLPLTNKMPEFSLDNEKEFKILVGNSLAALNNHYDILLMLKETDFKGSALLPCNYGGDKSGKHLLQLKNWTKELSLDVQFLETFISYDAYVHMILKCSAAIFYSYRQMALGNIFILITNGVKVYLSEKNPSFHWLKKKGFYIYTVEHDLRSDLQNNRIKIPKEHSIKNRVIYRSLIDPIHMEEFMKRLINVEADKKNK